MRAVMFSSPVATLTGERRRPMLERFGGVVMLVVASDGEFGHALFHEKRMAIAAAEALNEAGFEWHSVSLQLCDLDETECAVRLGDVRLSELSLARPGSGGDLFRVTETQPPVFWAPRRV